MKKNLPLLSFVFLLQFSSILFGQVTVTFPSDRAVFQRNNSHEASVYIGGYISEPFERIEARFVSLDAYTTAVPVGDGWAVVDNSIEAGHFYGSMVVREGWYKLEVRGVKKSGLTVSTAIDHVGVGEVFVIAGQSNATGGDQNPTGPSAQHDQVSSVNFQNYNAGTLTSYSYSNTQLPCPEYVHLDANTKTAPFGNYAWCWASFGDKLYEKFHVPIMIFNAGWSSTGSANWQQSIPTNGITNSAFGLPFPEGQPFGHLRLALNNYAAQLGIRAILWHQGETDNYLEKVNNAPTDYVNNLWQVISASRTVSGKENLAWVVARASRFTINNLTTTSQHVIDSQNKIINEDENYPYVYPGPETDPYYGKTYRGGDQIHFRGDGVNPDNSDGIVYSGLIHLAGFWADQITADFMNQSQPYAAIPPPAVSASYANTGLQITFTAPGSGSYNWLGVDCNQSEATSQSWTVGAGNYKLKMTDNNNNTVYSPRLFVSSSSLPVTWKSFHVKTSYSGRALIEWSTAAEINSSHFEVERSTDAISFKSIKTVNAAGESKNAISYQFEDEYLPSGTYYYRLKQVDLDERFEYTRIESVKVNANFAAKAYPNPVKEKLTIEAGESLGQVEVIDLRGVKRYTFDTRLRTTEVNMNSFPSGLYTVIVNGKIFKIAK
ncbi:sialate O-acetylesterase [Dyadobacter arcticus]|uniref:Por secretion system C-terminal sorting domain-containing protein n=1 Tax=Dyadobacter arcticus TaxID=1078754 RepID=A0ABX0UMY8_9BACT|nr:sialate O-acetylesterase [Dyadobacter arcticus]NIJ54326.1 hypothetical protein [Dyadobacter arcticus]